MGVLSKIVRKTQVYNHEIFTVKIILSRKGMDSASGGFASPILPSGEIVSLPIPEEGHKTFIPDAQKIKYEQIRFGNSSLGKIVEDLSRSRNGVKRVSRTTQAHFDPDLNPNFLDRLPDWMPVFGQQGAAQTHLKDTNKVDEGDVFLFFGWFREVEYLNGYYKYKRGSPCRHVIFGWFQIDRRIDMKDPTHIPPWALYHPHCTGQKFADNDCIYLPKPRVHLPGRTLDKPGAGIFTRYQEKLCLTADNQTGNHRYGLWRLPKWFYTKNEEAKLTYHKSERRWKLDGDSVLLSSVGRGQEFVLDTAHYPEAESWLISLISVGD